MERISYINVIYIIPLKETKDKSNAVYKKQTGKDCKIIVDEENYLGSDWYGILYVNAMILIKISLL